MGKKEGGGGGGGGGDSGNYIAALAMRMGERGRDKSIMVGKK